MAENNAIERKLWAALVEDSVFPQSVPLCLVDGLAVRNLRYVSTNHVFPILSVNHYL